MEAHAGRHASDIIRLSGVLRESDSIQVENELYAPLEKLLGMKDSAFSKERVKMVRGREITADLREIPEAGAIYVRGTDQRHRFGSGRRFSGRSL